MYLRKMLFSICIFFVFLFFVQPIHASDINQNIGKQFIIQVGNPKMLVNGGSILIGSNPKYSPIMYKGVVYVPAKNIVRHLGGLIEFDPTQKKVEITIDNVKLTTSLENNTIFVNNKLKEIGIAPLIIDSSVWIPVRTLTAGFDLRSKWDQVNQRIVFYYGGLGERWYENNYTVKVSNKHGTYLDQAIGYKMNYNLSWGDPLVIQKEDETVETIFYESKHLKINSYSDYMLSSYSDDEGLVLDESYEDYLYRTNLISDDVREESPGVVDKLYTIVEENKGDQVLSIVSFKGNQVGVMRIAVLEDLSARELKVLEEWQWLMETSFKPDGSVG
ncbi:copper amine oxidase N-terminal domain-containing protein [Paenibacillus sp. LS1]|uniref:copper amine oxidase N-terminal domain-containing protein n=1 Tax=Paenibacillus sp. LS1 TaxID=2992120 RepID=UPI00222E7D8E|nr:copper amine oxidase N-terminal domain-containing protein [Paenibacillus sp. LS1]MCW3795409.1 copper amine oxidase N-terminal domain-containing protein [Paenibacillus sp. LS1]